LTTGSGTPATDHAAAEELEGVVIRQRELNNSWSGVDPLLRVIVANGGTGMGSAAEVTRELLVPLAESDPGILGVIGLDRSVTETEQSITELGLHGIPAMGTTLTSVGLENRSPLYFQLVPNNVKTSRSTGRLRAICRRVEGHHLPPRPRSRQHLCEDAGSSRAAKT
jgi:hypothetical protein